jgi:Short-chain dehydrogenases of various substrate specificities
MKKFVVITGASSGIGYESAKQFAKRGKNLIVIARGQEKLQQLKDEIKEIDASLEVIIKAADLSVRENIYTVYDSVKGYDIELWLNNAGFGDYSYVNKQDIKKAENMINLNMEAVAIFTSLFSKDFWDVEGTQIINVSSVGGYTIVPTAITYCATKFFVSAFTEGLSHELIERGAKLRAKVFAPAATETNFGNVANNVTDYDYDKSFGTYHTCDDTVGFLMKLYDSDMPVGLVDRETFEFKLCDYQFKYAGSSKHNQTME